MLPAFIAFAVFILPWLIVGWLRIYYLGRFFQLEGYDSKRYLRWVTNNSAEIKHFVVVLILLILYSTIFVVTNTNSAYSGEIILFVTILNIFTYGLLTRYAPKNREVKQKFTPTQRAIRL